LQAFANQLANPKSEAYKELTSYGYTQSDINSAIDALVGINPTAYYPNPNGGYNSQRVSGEQLLQDGSSSYTIGSGSLLGLWQNGDDVIAALCNPNDNLMRQSLIGNAYGFAGISGAANSDTDAPQTSSSTNPSSSSTASESSSQSASPSEALPSKGALVFQLSLNGAESDNGLWQSISQQDGFKSGSSPDHEITYEGVMHEMTEINNTGPANIGGGAGQSLGTGLR